MAAQYTNKNRENIDGLMIWAAYPAGNSDLSDADIPVVLMYGSLDPRVNDLSVSERKHLLPEDTQYIRIDGGGHHQFGAYEIKPEEHQAVIPRTAQHEQILNATLALLAQAEK
jgi:pimeloyl-ACP methyl ester carboxylesterase